MNGILNQQKQLAHFINFHTHPHADSYNTIDGIFVDRNIRDDIKKVMQLLKKPYLFLEYHPEDNAETFLQTLAQALMLAQVVFIVSDSLHIDPLTYDQCIQFRTHNTFTFTNSTLHPDAKLYLIIQGKNHIIPQALYALTDHILSLQEGGEE